MRGVTKNLEDRIVHNEISTHTPHAGRDVIAYNLKSQNKISTHTPHAGRDIKIRVLLNPVQFLLTRPMRGVTISRLR